MCAGQMYKTDVKFVLFDCTLCAMKVMSVILTALMAVLTFCQVCWFGSNSQRN